jgi:hypothetical protein
LQGHDSQKQRDVERERKRSPQRNKKNPEARQIQKPELISTGKHRRNLRGTRFANFKHKEKQISRSRVAVKAHQERPQEKSKTALIPSTFD